MPTAGRCWGHRSPQASIALGDRAPQSLHGDIVSPLLSRPAVTSLCCLFCNTIFSCKNCFLLTKYKSSPSWWQGEESFSGGDRTHGSQPRFTLTFQEHIIHPRHLWLPGAHHQPLPPPYPPPPYPPQIPLTETS